VKNAGNANLTHHWFVFPALFAVRGPLRGPGRTLDAFALCLCGLSFYFLGGLCGLCV
jgi:hypothetical protein